MPLIHAAAQLGGTPLPGRDASGDTGWTMSHDNVEVVRRLIDAWNGNEQERVVPLERVVPFLDPGVIFDATRRIINPKIYAGQRGFGPCWPNGTRCGEFRMEPDEFVDAGDRVAAIGRWVGKGSGSGVEVTQPMADVFTLHGGRVVRCEIGYSDRAEPSKPPGCAGRPKRRTASLRRAAGRTRRPAAGRSASHGDPDRRSTRSPGGCAQRCVFADAAEEWLAHGARARLEALHDQRLPLRSPRICCRHLDRSRSNESRPERSRRWSQWPAEHRAPRQASKLVALLHAIFERAERTHGAS